MFKTRESVAWRHRGPATVPLCHAECRRKVKIMVKGERDWTYFELAIERYSVQKTPHVDWNGTR